MPITLKKGDMFAEQVDAYVNPINCQGRMGAGVALEFAKRYPEMYKNYRKFCDTGQLRPGILHFFNEGGKLIINFPTKDHVFRASEVPYITSGLRALREYLEDPECPVKSLVLPALGCGHGGLEWDIVKPLITSYLRNLPQDIRVFLPHNEHTEVSFDDE